MKININTIYLATEGEGVRIGTPQIFVRFQGCPVGCQNCDSRETWPFLKKYEIHFDEAIKRIDELSQRSNPSLKAISFTGGEPLIEKNCEGLLLLGRHYKNQGFYLNVETSGQYYHEEIFDLCDFISMDFKTSCTGVAANKTVIEKTVATYGSKLQLKSVIATADDFWQTHAFYLEIKEKFPHIIFPWCLTPAYNLNEDFPQRRFHEILELNQKNGSYFRFIGQQHKWMYGPREKDV